MNRDEAIEFLEWYDEKYSEHMYSVYCKTSKPFSIEFPELILKKTQALISLGKHEFQQPYEKLAKMYPNLTIDRYDKRRLKLGII